MPRSAATFLMFEGRAEEAMNLYAEVFRSAEVGGVVRWGEGEPGAAGSLKRAHLRLCGHELIFFDSPGKHDFSFTPSISLWVECEDEAEIDAAFERLSAEGKTLMPLGGYGFSRKFGWLADRFGVSWQLNLA